MSICAAAICWIYVCVCGWECVCICICLLSCMSLRLPTLYFFFFLWPIDGQYEEVLSLFLCGPLPGCPSFPPPLNLLCVSFYFVQSHRRTKTHAHADGGLCRDGLGIPLVFLSHKDKDAMRETDRGAKAGEEGREVAGEGGCLFFYFFLSGTSIREVRWTHAHMHERTHTCTDEHALTHAQLKANCFQYLEVGRRQTWMFGDKRAKRDEPWWWEFFWFISDSPELWVCESMSRVSARLYVQKEQ